MMDASPIRVAIVDPCCSAGYTPMTLAAGSLGGTEATVLRVTAMLARGTGIMHFQKGRDVAEVTEAGQMLPLEAAFVPGAARTLVVVNSWKVACKLRKVHPNARILLWLHIHPGRHNHPMAAALHEADIGVVCVSQSHARQLRAFLNDDMPLRIDHIHNPIADNLAPNATLRDPDRLLFASSPHKGLAQVFDQFRAVRAAIPGMTLAVADPGYLAWDTGPVPDGVTFLGTLPHASLIGEMRRSSCLFYPQTTFAETFGLVLAEANAVGLPVLVHRDLGANAEVAGHSAQLIDGTDIAAIIDRLRIWRATPPVVSGNPEFRLRTVVRRWADLLGFEDAEATVSQRVA
jgi:glycosyltransferase involved in cell wall biosynthesis